MAYFLGWHGVKLGGTCSTYKFGNTIDQDLQVTEGFFCEGFSERLQEKMYYCEKDPQKQLLLKCHAQTQQGLHKVSTTFEKEC